MDHINFLPHLKSNKHSVEQLCIVFLFYGLNKVNGLVNRTAAGTRIRFIYHEHNESAVQHFTSCKKISSVCCPFNAKLFQKLIQFHRFLVGEFMATQIKPYS